MDTLDRFLLREFFGYFFVILLGLAFLYLGIDFFSKFWIMPMPFGRALELYAYRIPMALQTFVPVSCLMSALLVLSSMSRQNEILALYASGVGNLRLMSTFVAAVAVISTISFLVFDSLVPPLNKKISIVERGLDPSKEELLFSSTQGFWYRSGRLIYNVGHFQAHDSTIDKLNVYLLSPDFRIQERLKAKHAVFDPKSDRWILHEGFRVKYPLDNSLPLADNFQTSPGEIPERPKDFRVIKIREDMMGLKELRKAIEKLSDYGLETTVKRVNYQERLAVIFTPLVFLILGFRFGLSPLKTPSMSASIGFSFVVVFLYFLTFRISLSIGKGGHIPPIIAAWAPNVIFLSLWGVANRRKS